MRPRLIVALLGVVIALASPAGAQAAFPVSKLLFVEQGSPMALVQSNATVPLHFTVSAGQAIRIAETSRVLRALHQRMHPLRVVPYVWRSMHPYWYVIFTYRGKIVADADVSSTGQLNGVWTGPQALAPYTHGHLASVLNSWLILVPFSLLFLLPFFDPRRLRRIVFLDALAVVSFLGSYEFLAHAQLEPAVWLAYPPLIYLLARMLRIGFRRGGRTGRLAPLLRTPVLAGGLLVMIGARIAISLLGHQEIDVGYESVIGAFRILHHLPIYWNDSNHGDTYGPVTYLAYVPFQLLFPWKNSLSSLPAADAAAIFFDLGTIVALFFLGRRMRPGPEATRLGLILAWGWAACPFTVYGLMVHTNDALVSMLCVLVLLAVTSPLASGALLGLATAAKFSPAALVPLIAAPRRRGLRGALVCGGTFAAVVGVAIYAWLPPQGFSYFWQRTIHFQLTRTDVYSPWALHPGLHPLQVVLEVAAVLLVAAVAFIPRKRSLIQVSALAAAVTIAVQLPARHWFYYYIMWFLPFVLVALLVPEREGASESPGVEPVEQGVHIEDHRPEPVRELVRA
jgi:hypothetical protein